MHMLIHKYEYEQTCTLLMYMHTLKPDTLQITDTQEDTCGHTQVQADMPVHMHRHTHINIS